MQVATHFEIRGSKSSKRRTLNHKFIPNSPQHPGKDPNGEPPNVAQRGWVRLEFGKESGEVVMVPASTHNLTETTP